MEQSCLLSKMVLLVATSNFPVIQALPFLKTINQANPLENFLFSITVPEQLLLKLILHASYGLSTETLSTTSLKILLEREERNMKIF